MPNLLEIGLKRNGVAGLGLEGALGFPAGSRRFRVLCRVRRMRGDVHGGSGVTCRACGALRGGIGRCASGRLRAERRGARLTDRDLAAHPSAGRVDRDSRTLVLRSMGLEQRQHRFGDVRGGRHRGLVFRVLNTHLGTSLAGICPYAYAEVRAASAIDSRRVRTAALGDVRALCGVELIKPNVARARIRNSAVGVVEWMAASTPTQASM